MIEELIFILQTSFLPLGAVGVFLASFIEEVIAPIPSSIVTITAGFLFLSGPVTTSFIWRMIMIVVLPTALGMTLGSIVIYCIGYFGGKPIIVRWGRFLGVSWSSVESFQERLQKGKKDEIILLIVRMIPLVPSVVIGLVAGLVRYKIKTFIVITFIGSAVRAVGLACIGWLVGATYYQYADLIGRFEYVGLVIIVVLSVGLYILYRYKHKKRHMI